MSQNFVNAVLTENTKTETPLKEGHVLLTWENGRVKYTYPEKRDESFSEMEPETLEETPEDLNYQMGDAILKIEKRREKYRVKDFIEYGYDKYMEECKYEPDVSDTESLSDE